MSDKRKFIKKPYAGKKSKAWKKPTKSLPNKQKRKLPKSKGSYYNQGKCGNMEKGSIVMNITTEERFGIYKFLEVLEFPNIKQIESAHFS